VSLLHFNQLVSRCIVHSRSGVRDNPRCPSCPRSAMGTTLVACTVLWIVFVATIIESRAQSRVSIGVSTSATGPASNYGVDVINTIIFANKVLAGSVYDLVIEDDRCDGKTAASVAKKLVEIDRVQAILGYTCSSSLMAVAPYLDRNKIVAIAAGTTAPQIADAGEYIFRTIQGDTEGARLIFNRAVANYKTLGVLSAQTEWNEGIRASLVALAKSSPLTLRVEEVIPQPYEYKSSLVRLIRGGADALFLNVMPEAAFLAALKQAQELHFRGDILAFYHPGSTSFRQKVRGPLPPIYYIDNGSPAEIFTPQGRELLAQFEKEYGPLNSVPLTFASAFESFRAIHEAIKAGGSTKEYLLSHSFNGTIGTWSFDKRGEMLGLNVRLIRYAS
jgi:branched-chain amino acid transport system substrate-binding protein